MGWVQGFQHDVFLSYARVDNATAEGDPSRGWVSQFHRHLEVALSKKVGRLDAIRIWRDTREIPGNKLFDKTIQDAVEQSAVFVALTSRGYLESVYCREELEAFVRSATHDAVGLAAGDNYRIFNVLLNNVARGEWPTGFGRTTGFCLNDAEDAITDGEPSAIGHESFAVQLRELSRAIHLTLVAIRERTRHDPPATTPPPKGFSVFVAETSDSLRSVRKRTMIELAQITGVSVIADVPPPFAPAEHDERVREIVGSVDLSVHLLDGLAGRELGDTDGVGYPQRQAELATRHGASQLIWVPKDLAFDTIDNETYRTFLDTIENGPRDRRTYDVQRALPSAVPQQILSRIEELRSKRPATVAPAANAALLDTHVKDQLHALELSHYLIRHNVQPYINPQEDDPGRNLALFTERLKQASILILFCGAVADEWLRARIGVALKIAIVEECPLQACGVYLAPPRSPGAAPQLRLPLVPLQWMDHTNGFNAAAVDELLHRARASSGLRAS
jgi:hypothetical protein